MKSLATLMLASVFCFQNAGAQLASNMVKYPAERTYTIGTSSTLKIEGHTNVNGFTCGCTEQFTSQKFTLGERDDVKLTTNFWNTKLKIRITSLDCGHKIMNKDLQQALNSDKHPYISIELLKVTEDKCSRLSSRPDWVKLKALARITINNRPNEYWLDITARRTAPNHYRFIGSKPICMSDFGVKPPVAMMGMVKVQDSITIHLDLDIILN